MKKLILLATASLLATSCAKTYQCKDQAGIINGEVSAYSHSKGIEKCKTNGSMIAIYKPKGQTSTVTVFPPACEQNKTGIITFNNIGKKVLKITLGSGAPAGFDNLEPGKKVSAVVPAAAKHQFTVSEVNGNTGAMSSEISVNTCAEETFHVQL